MKCEIGVPGTQGVCTVPFISIFEHQRQKRTSLLGASAARLSRRQ